jgi:hypothetical protein
MFNEIKYYETQELVSNAYLHMFWIMLQIAHLVIENFEIQ